MEARIETDPADPAGQGGDPSAAVGRTKRFPTRDDWRIVGLIVALKAILFLFSTAAFEITEDRRLEGFAETLEIWKHWDVTRYLLIAETGYQTPGKPYLIAFFPLFPWMMRALAMTSGMEFFTSGFLIATVASIAAGVLFHRLARVDFPSRTSWMAVFFLFVFPTSYFLHIPYTESLFLALVVGSFLAARTGHWALSGLLGALASLTRITGIVLLPALLVEAAHEFYQTRRWRWRWLWSLVVMLGFLAYLGLNYQQQGEPLAFLKYQQEKFDRTLVWPWTGLLNVMGEMDKTSARDAQMVGMQESLFALLGLAGTIGCWIRLRPSYAVWMTGNWLAMICSSFVLSVPRYTLMLFPLFLLFALLARERIVGAVITAWSLLFLGLFVRQFVTESWAF